MYIREKKRLRIDHRVLNAKEQEKKYRTLRVGFEPTREDHIGFQVQRLNRSAIAAIDRSIDHVSNVDEWTRSNSFQLINNQA